MVSGDLKWKGHISTTGNKAIRLLALLKQTFICRDPGLCICHYSTGANLIEMYKVVNHRHIISSKVNVSEELTCDKAIISIKIKLKQIFK